MKFEIGDIIEVSITLDVDIPEEELAKNVIDIDNYEKNYSVDYHCERSGSACSYEFTVEKGFSIDDDIDVYVKEDLKKIYPEITGYEIFDVEKDDIDYQSAKIKITSLKL